MVEYRSDMILWILKENYSGCWETNKPWRGKIKRRLVKKKKADQFGDCYGYVGERRCWLVPWW